MKQVCEIRDNFSRVKSRNAVVYGVNPGSGDSHKKFAQKYDLPFPLLVDEGQQVAKLYQANGLLVKRTVYLVDPEGVIRFAQRGMPKPDEILKYAK